METYIHTKKDISPLFSNSNPKENENQNMLQVTLCIRIE